MIESPPTPATSSPVSRRSHAMPRRYGALAGLVAGAVAVTIGMLVAGIIDVVSPIDAVGSEFIDRVPPWLKELAIQWFGTNDKLALRIGIIVTSWPSPPLIVGYARRSPHRGRQSLASACSGWSACWPRCTAPASPRRRCAAAADRRSDRHRRCSSGSLRPIRPTASRRPGRHGCHSAGTAGGSWSPPVRPRRPRSSPVALARALERAADRLDPRGHPDTLPPDLAAGSTAIAYRPTPTLSPVTPFITPNSDFYRIDTALSFPRISLASWKVDIGGMVDTPLTFTYDDLLARPQVERIVTLCCVSNEVGGEYISNAVVSGRDAGRPAERSRRARRAPSRCSAPASTGGRADSRSPLRSTAATR